MSTMIDEGPDQGKLIEAEDERNRGTVPHLSYEGAGPVSSFHLTEANRLEEIRDRIGDLKYLGVPSAMLEPLYDYLAGIRSW